MSKRADQTNLIIQRYQLWSQADPFTISLAIVDTFQLFSFKTTRGGNVFLSRRRDLLALESLRWARRTSRPFGRHDISRKVNFTLLFRDFVNNLVWILGR